MAPRQICIGPEFSGDSEGKLHIRGTGSKAWPLTTTVVGAGNGLAYDPENGGLYTSPHGVYRQQQRYQWTDGLVFANTGTPPLGTGDTWTNPSLITMAVTNPSLVSPMALQWRATFNVTMKFPPGIRVRHLIAAGMDDLTDADMMTVCTFGNSPNSAYAIDLTPWNDTRQINGWTLLPPGETVGIRTRQQAGVSAWGNIPTSNTKAQVSGAFVEVVAQLIAIDPLQSGGYL